MRKIADELREIADSLDNAKAAPAEDKVDEKEVVKDEVEKKDDVEKKDEVENKDDVEKKDEVENKDDVENKDKVEEEDKPEAEAEQNDYTVVKGDCVWNIAKADLTQKLGRKPTNAEILKRTDEIMELNKEVSDEDKEAGFVKLEWAEDHYHVMIRPGDKIKLAAPEKKILLTA